MDRLARDIRGIGFRTADQIAIKVGIDKVAMIRIRAGVSYGLAEAMDQGHGGLPEDELIKLTAALIEVLPDRIATALELEGGTVVADTLKDRRCIFLAGLYRAEQAIAERLRTLAAGRPPWPEIDAAKAIPWLEARAGISLAESQREALRLALASKVLISVFPAAVDPLQTFECSAANVRFQCNITIVRFIQSVDLR